MWLDRFDGRGPVLRYSMESGTWSRTAGALILEAGTGGWSFDPWTDTRTVLPG